jgi:hypothetical protein
MTEQEHALVVNTVSTPGWEIIKRKAESKIRLEWETLLINDSEQKVVELFHRASAARAVLHDFLSEVEAPPPVILDGKEFNEKEAEF